MGIEEVKIRETKIRNPKVQTEDIRNQEIKVHRLEIKNNTMRKVNQIHSQVLTRNQNQTQIRMMNQEVMMNMDMIVKEVCMRKLIVMMTVILIVDLELMMMIYLEERMTCNRTMGVQGLKVRLGWILERAQETCKFLPLPCRHLLLEL